MTKSSGRHALLNRIGSFSTRPSGRGHFHGLEPGGDGDDSREVADLKARLEELEVEVIRLSAGRTKNKRGKDPEYRRVIAEKQEVEEQLSGMRAGDKVARLYFLMEFLKETRSRLDQTEFNEIFELAGKRAKKRLREGGG